MSVIALDYDDTFTDNPLAWDSAIAQLKSCGYEIVGVTLRNRYTPVCDHYMSICDTIVYCAGHAKKDVLARIGYHDVIWIDDNPKYIVRSYADVNGERLYIADSAADLYTPMLVKKSNSSHTVTNIIV